MSHEYDWIQPTPEEVARAVADVERQGPCSEGHMLRIIATRFARWGAEKMAEKLEGQWPTPITDRPPTEADGDKDGKVQYVNLRGAWETASWCSVAATPFQVPWRHCPGWEPQAPPEPTLQDQALVRLRAELKETCRAWDYNKWEVLDLAIRALEQSGEGVA